MFIYPMLTWLSGILKARQNKCFDWLSDYLPRCQSDLVIRIHCSRARKDSCHILFLLLTFSETQNVLYPNKNHQLFSRRTSWDVGTLRRIIVVANLWPLLLRNCLGSQTRWACFEIFSKVLQRGHWWSDTLLQKRAPFTFTPSHCQAAFTGCSDMYPHPDVLLVDGGVTGIVFTFTQFWELSKSCQNSVLSDWKS